MNGSHDNQNQMERQWATRSVAAGVAELLGGARSRTTGPAHSIFARERNAP